MFRPTIIWTSGSTVVLKPKLPLNMIIATSQSLACFVYLHNYKSRACIIILKSVNSIGQCLPWQTVPGSRSCLRKRALRKQHRLCEDPTKMLVNTFIQRVLPMTYTIWQIHIYYLFTICYSATIFNIAQVKVARYNKFIHSLVAQVQIWSEFETRLVRLQRTLSCRGCGANETWPVHLLVKISLIQFAKTDNANCKLINSIRPRLHDKLTSSISNGYLYAVGVMIVNVWEQ